MFDEDRWIRDAMREGNDNCIVLPPPFRRHLDWSMFQGETHHDARAAEVQKLLTKLETLSEQQRSTLALMSIFAARLTDMTHLTVAEFARLKGVSEKTVRNWISDQKVKREVIPGTRQAGIPVEQASSGWIDAKTAKLILNKLGKGMGRKAKR